LFHAAARVFQQRGGMQTQHVLFGSLKVLQQSVSEIQLLRLLLPLLSQQIF
jgi:hypothetical protein